MLETKDFNVLIFCYCFEWLVSLGFKKQFLEVETNRREWDLSPTSFPRRGEIFWNDRSLLLWFLDPHESFQHCYSKMHIWVFGYDKRVLQRLSLQTKWVLFQSSNTKKNQEDELEVLWNYKKFHPLSKEMRIVNNCIEAISMRILMGLFETRYQLNEGISVESCEASWINDLWTLLFDYFGQIIAFIWRLQMKRNSLVERYCFT